MTPWVKAAGSGAVPVASSSPRVAFLALSTSGWSKGLMPRIRPAAAVATSQSSSWAPREPLTWISERDGSRSPERPVSSSSVPATSATSRATVICAEGERTSGSWSSRTTTGSTPVPFLPVLSAISCSAQSANPGIREPSLTRTSLVRSGCVPAMAAPRRRAGFASSSSASRSATDSASSSSASRSTPARPLGTSPNAVRAEYRPPTLGSALMTR